MNKSQIAYELAIQEVDSIINRCEKMHIKFREGTSQHTLLKNRLHAMYVAKTLLLHKGSNTNETICYTQQEYDQALPPILSILHKCEKAQSKYDVGSTQFLRYCKPIDTMHLIKELILEQQET